MLRRHVSPIRLFRQAATAWLAIAVVGTGSGNSASAQQSVPGTGPKTGLTREELTRSWDLDGDGTISKPEADVARARMKRERVEMQLGGGVDPVTGLPRSLGVEQNEEHTPGDEPEFRLPPEQPPLPTSRTPRDAGPGIGGPSLPAPRITPPAAGGGGSAPRAPRIDPSRPAEGSGTTGDSSARPSGASWLAPNQRASAVTGGVRAGAPAAAAGYGSGPWSDLNAARSRYAPAPPAGPPGGAAGRGALGAGTSSRRTGSILLPGGGRPLSPGLGSPLDRSGMTSPSFNQPLAPPPPRVQPPRVSAEEIGGY